MIGNFGGTRASDFLPLIGADTSARFLEVECVDGYYESIDMETALHPQTLLCYEMYGKPLDRGHGAPLQLQMPTKIGYKQAKYLDLVRVTNVLEAGKRGQKSKAIAGMADCESSDGDECGGNQGHESTRGRSPCCIEHPWIVRVAHWLNAVAVFVLVGSGLRIFPSFGPKIPQEDLIGIPEQITIGGWAVRSGGTLPSCGFSSLAG